MTGSKPRAEGPICGLDTMIVIWGFGLSLRTADQELIVRARILLDMLEEENATVVVPMVTVSEVLTPMDPGEHGAIIVKLQQHCLCPAFDLRAASIAASITASHQKLPEELKYAGRRGALKADAQIIATCKAVGATRFYSHDAKCRKLASLVMEAYDLPTKHPNMHVEQEIRRGEWDFRLPVAKPPKKKPAE